MQHHVSFDLDFKRNPYKGKFIAIEGIDGSGKTTQVKKLGEYFKNQDKEILITKEPTREEPIGRLINRVLHQEIKMPSKALQYLLAADRVIHYEENIIPALEKGQIIVSDRSFWSSVAYGFLDKELNINSDNDKELLLVSRSILSMYNQFITPDKTIYIDAPVDLAVERISKKTSGKEIYEEKEKLAKIAAGYKWLMQKFPEEFIVIDGTKTAEEVSIDIMEHIKNF